MTEQELKKIREEFFEKFVSPIDGAPTVMGSTVWDFIEAQLKKQRAKTLREFWNLNVDLYHSLGSGDMTVERILKTIDESINQLK